MIFEANSETDLSKVAVSEVIEKINLSDFLKELQKYKKNSNLPSKRFRSGG